MENKKFWWAADFVAYYVSNKAVEADVPILHKALVDGTTAYTPPAISGMCSKLPPDLLGQSEEDQNKAIQEYLRGFAKAIHDVLGGKFCDSPFRLHYQADGVGPGTCPTEVWYSFPQGYFTIGIRRAGPMSPVCAAVEFSLSDISYAERFHDVIRQWVGDPPPPAKRIPEVFGFSMGMNGPSIVRVGKVDTNLERENYSPEVLCQFNRVVAELKKGNPSGRLVLIDGVPGTGKTYLIRALIGALVEDSACVVVPPNLMDQLSGPDFLMCLIRHRDSTGKPLTLILEDADNCLIDRNQIANGGSNQNLSNLSALLNLSDGILGATLDLRVVATTNQQIKNIDRAIMRSGRLLEHISVGTLDLSQAMDIYHRLSGRPPRDGEISTSMTLADIYEAARKASR